MGSRNACKEIVARSVSFYIFFDILHYNLDCKSVESFVPLIHKIDFKYCFGLLSKAP